MATILSLNEILKNDIVDNLEGSDAVLIKTVMDLSSRVRPGRDSVQIPKVSGLTLGDVTPGTRAAAGAMASTSDTLLLNQIKEVAEYVDYDDGLDSALDLKEAFLDGAPKVYAEGIEEAISTALSASAALGSGTIAESGEAAGLFVIGDISSAKKTLDEAKVPKSDRWMAVNAASMEVLASFAEFQDGSKALSSEALRQGIVSQVKGFNVVQSEDVLVNEVYCYHRSACAFAMHDGVKFIEKEIEEFAQTFLSLRGKFGVKAIDAGSRMYRIDTKI